ncbi:hypothetical protein [Haladaptatus sp. NG-SE-30]
MPISDAEWEDGQISESHESPGTTPVGEYDTEKDLVVAFLDENAENAYTKWEIVRGVDFDSSDDPSQIRDISKRPNPLREAAEELTDAAGDVVASGMVVDDINDALDELVAEGTVETKEIESDGESNTYYRLVTSET